MLIIDGDIIVHRAGALDFHQAAFGIISIGDGLGCNDGADHQQPRSHSRQYPTSSHAHAPVAEIKRIETRKYCLDESYWTRPLASTPHTIIRPKLAAFLVFANSPQPFRSEESRLGNAGVRHCRFRWSRSSKQKKVIDK